MDRVHRQDGRDLLTRTVGPGLALWALVVGIGLLLTGPLDPVDDAEESVSKAFARNRTSLWDAITDVWSRLGNTEIVIGVCVIAVALLLSRTRNWRLAATPAIAIALQATIFVLAAGVVGRDRPPVPPMDTSPPTSSFPSGHVGASTALYTAFALLALRIERVWLRWTVVAVCAVVPLLVAYARLYRGAHHVTDIVVGLLNGLACALLAYGWYRHRQAAGTDGRHVSADSAPADGHA
jgi:membrane-associated phospholipid phosphatase